MPSDPAEVLRLIFGLQPDQIQKDEDAAVNRLEQLNAESAAYIDVPREERTSESEALQAHREMLMGHAFAAHQTSPDAALFLISSAAEHVAEEAAEATRDHGRLAELSVLMREIEQREGLGPDEFWKIGDAPADYEELSRESTALFEETMSNIFIHLLRRYGYGTLADLYEEDRANFEIMKEVGRRLNSMSDSRDAEVDAFFADQILKDHGRKALARLQKRLEENGL